MVTTDLPRPESKSTLQTIEPPKQYPLAHFFFIVIVFTSSYPIHWSSQVICFIIDAGNSSGVRAFSVM